MQACFKTTGKKGRSLTARQRQRKRQQKTAALKLQISTLVLLQHRYQEEQEAARAARLDKGRTSKERAPEASRLKNTTVGQAHSYSKCVRARVC